MANQTLIPAFITFTLDSNALNIVDTQLSLSFDNGSSYEECMTKTGDKGYIFNKGITVLQDGDITIKIKKTSDKKQEDTIKSLQSAITTVNQSADPKDYAKSVAVVVEDPSNTKFLDVTFSGYVSEFYTLSPDLTDFPEYMAKIEVFDPTTINISS